MLTSGSPGRTYKLRIDLTDFENETRFAEYSGFTVASAADYYRLELGTYFGDAGLFIESFKATFHYAIQVADKVCDLGTG